MPKNVHHLNYFEDSHYITEHISLSIKWDGSFPIPGRQEAFLKEYEKRYGELLYPRYLKRFHVFEDANHLMDVLHGYFRTYTRYNGTKEYPIHTELPIIGHYITDIEEAYKILEENGFEVIWDHTLLDKRINGKSGAYYSWILIHQK